MNPPVMRILQIDKQEICIQVWLGGPVCEVSLRPRKQADLRLHPPLQRQLADAGSFEMLAAPTEHPSLVVPAERIIKLRST